MCIVQHILEKYIGTLEKEYIFYANNNFSQCIYQFYILIFFQMNILLISLFAVASLSTFPARTYGTELADKSQLTQQTVALTAEDHQPAAGGGEIWQETEREVLIRNERGTKNINNNGGNGGAGKKGKNKKEKKEKVITSDTQEQTGGKSGIFTLYNKKNDLIYLLTNWFRFNQNGER